MGIYQRVKKGKWSAKEDVILLAFSEEKGPRPLWSELNCHPDPGQRLNRDSKSCRLRYENHLKPGLKHGPLTTEEQAVVVKMQLEVGNKWALIAAQLEGRTDNALKNWWNARFKPRKKNRHSDKDSRQIAREGKPTKHLQRMTNSCHLRPDGMSEEELSSGSSSRHDGQEAKRSMEPLASSTEVLMTKREFHHAAFGRGDRPDRITVGNLRAGLRKVPSISNHLSKGTGSELTEDRDSSECSRSGSPRTSNSEEPPASMQGLVLEGVPTKAAPAETLLNNPPGSTDIVWGPFDAGLNGNWGPGCDVGLGWKIAMLQQSAISDEAQSPLDEGMAPHCSLLVSTHRNLLEFRVDVWARSEVLGSIARTNDAGVPYI